MYIFYRVRLLHKFKPI